MTEKGLSYLAVEISWGSTWVNINNGEQYKINSEQTRDSASKTWRKTLADSPVLGGNYLVHAVPEMVTEQLSVWVYGSDQADLSENYYGLERLFEQYDFRIRWTFDDYREYWRCQLPDVTYSRGHVWTHNLMAIMNFQIPRYPDVTTELV